MAAKQLLVSRRRKAGMARVAGTAGKLSQPSRYILLLHYIVGVIRFSPALFLEVTARQNRAITVHEQRVDFARFDDAR